ncbi:hypothetical protein ABZ851_15095 [Streptomyces sp. NPDC047049]|uniref:hypothetical protein n=1 Tax=Streptomyces sp. NPDC047049 TaxID=3156688 RepID=UPI0033D1317C
MPYPVVRGGDQIRAAPSPGTLFLPVPFLLVTLTGTGEFTACGQKVCVPSDIEGLSVQASYIRPPTFPNAGSGTIRFTLAPTHKTIRSHTKHGRPIVIDDGAKLTYTYVVATRASGNTGTDPAPPTSGSADFQRRPMPAPVRAG